jgi:hypothetical protein
VQQCTLGCVGADAVHSAQQQRVVGDQQLVATDRLVDGLGHRVHRHQHGFDGIGRIAAHEPDGVPLGGERGRVGGLQCGDDVADGRGHAATASSASVSAVTSRVTCAAGRTATRT